MTTTLLTNGTIVDGSGSSGFDGHLLIEDEQIKAVIRSGEPRPEADGVDAILDVKGLTVCPGFIDMHSHADWLLPLEDHAALLRPLLEQGITTVVAGNCGMSPAPVTTEKKVILSSLASLLIEEPFHYRWRSLAEFLRQIGQTPPPLNLAQLVGHASIRLAAADTRRGAMTRAELGACRDELEQAFDAGACGLSFGLGYDPGMYSPLEELEAFCGRAAECGKIVTVHLKALSRISPCYPLSYLGAHNLRALREMLDIARKTGVRLQLSHFIFAGRNSWRTADRCIALVDEAVRQGVDVMVDAYPHTCGNTHINVSLPYWFLARLPGAYRDRWARLRLRAELGVGYRLVGFGYGDFQVMDVAVPGWEELNGLRVDRIAARWNTSPFDAMLTLSENSSGAALMLYHTFSGEPGNEGALERVLAHDRCLFETDTVIKRSGYPNPATMGAFPKILGDFCRRRGLFTLQDAVRRMTSASAERFGLRDRGLLKPGLAADVVVFDADAVQESPPAGGRPAGKPRGIEHVFVNGSQVVSGGEYCAQREAGRVLRP